MIVDSDEYHEIDKGELRIEKGYSDFQTVGWLGYSDFLMGSV